MQGPSLSFPILSPSLSYKARGMPSLQNKTQICLTPKCMLSPLRCAATVTTTLFLSLFLET